MSVTVTGEDGRLRATFLPELGMLCASIQVDGEERLDPRRGVDAYRERGKTMGIPLLYPWANRVATREFELADRSVRLPEPGTTIGADEHGLPIHGVQPRLMRWAAEPDGTALGARLDWRSRELLDIFPFPHSVAYEAAAGPGAELRISITVRADDEARVPVAFGLHPYLRLPGDRAAAQLALPACTRLETDERGIPTGRGEPAEATRTGLTRGWDDGLALGGGETEPSGPAPANDDGSPVLFGVSGDAGRIAIEFLEGFTHGQVFSPDGAEFVCVEPMTAPANGLVSGHGLRILPPGESLRASVRIAWTTAEPAARPT